MTIARHAKSHKRMTQSTMKARISEQVTAIKHEQNLYQALLRHTRNPVIATLFQKGVASNCCFTRYIVMITIVV